MTEITLDYVPLPRQMVLHATKAQQILYGGAVGGAKSHGIRWDLIRWCLKCPGIDTFLFRRTLGELEDNHIRKIRSEIPAELGHYREQKKRFEFKNSSGINFCYCEREADVERYQGAEMHVLGVDEAAHLTGYQLKYLRTRVRLGGYQPPKQYAEFLPRILFGSNPGGPGHNFLKETFIDPAPAETIFCDETTSIEEDGFAGMSTIFIPAKMSDNKYLDRNYAGQLNALPPELARALRDGDWDAVVGQALHNLSRDRHLLRPFSPPKHWTRFMVMDWGYAKPFSVGWYAVSDGVILAPQGKWPERYLPAGAVIRYDEYYGWNGSSNEGCRMDSGAVARKILLLEDERKDVMDYRIGDSQMWAQTDGPSITENMLLATDGRFVMRRSEKDRKANYGEIIARLAGNPEFRDDGKEEQHPMFFVTANCRHFWRTVPTLVLDKNDPEKGPETLKSEDHVYDDVAYALRSRPYVSTKEDRWYRENEQYMQKSVDPYAM